MQSGKLRYSVAIQQQTTGRSAAGAKTNTWTTVATVRAGFTPSSGREVLVGQKIDAEVDTVIAIRYLANMAPEMRIVFTDNAAGRTRFFDVVFVKDVQERHREMLLLCKEANIPAGTVGSVSGQPPIGAGFSRKSFAEALDGARTAFTLPTSPSSGGLQVFLNGILLSSPQDYTLAGNIVTFGVAPQVNDTIFAYY